MSNISSKRAPGPIGKTLRSGSNGSLGWPSTATISGLTPGDADRHDARGRRVGEPEADARAGRGGQRQRRRRGIGGHEGAEPPGGARDARVGKVVLISPLSSSRQSARTTIASTSAAGGFASSTTIGPKRPAADLPRGRAAGVGQIEVEAGVGRREADVELAAGRDRRLRRGRRCRRARSPSAGRESSASCLVEAVGEPQRQLFALAAAAAAARERRRHRTRQRVGAAGGARDRARGGRGLETTNAVRRRRRRRARPAAQAQSRRNAAAEKRAAVRGAAPPPVKHLRQFGTPPLARRFGFVLGVAARRGEASGAAPWANSSRASA